MLLYGMQRQIPPRSIHPLDIIVKKRKALIIGASRLDLKIIAMTRSIPSIIVLSLMCFTISYGIIRFPNAGILDAAQSSELSSTDSSMSSRTALKPTIDGSALQVNEPSTVLAEPQTPSKELFESQPTTAPVEDAADSKPEIEAADNNASAEPENKKASDNKKKKSNDKNKSNKKSDEPQINESDLPMPEPINEPEPADNKSEEPQDDSAGLIGIPDVDQAEHDDSMPIKTDKDPLPNLDKNDADIPSIFVDNNLPESELGPLSEPEPVEQDDLSIPEPTPEEEKSVDDYWNTIFDESEQSNKDKSKTDAVASSEPEKQTPKTTAPTEIPTDPNAQEIPPHNRETKPANQDALTQPALDEPQNPAPNANQPDTGTIPMESFPLDASAMQKVNYTVDYQQEPYDPFGFNVPETGEIIVKRLPPIENSVDPIYNNAQLDRFAL